MKLANEQDRVLSVIRFESICFEPIQIHPKEDIDQMIRLLITSPTNGGTKFQAPLEKARDIIEQDADYSEVDIVFITDGIAPLTSMFLQEYSESLEKLKANFFLLEIEPELRWSNTLRDLVNQSWVIDTEGNFEDLGVACSTSPDPQNSPP
ncbi:hypothetical protein [Acaryochloris marina]|uniref:vWA domain-containing protein n=1 Tax=Acaryochloris marina TaxID=155978 RepID=UPI001BAFBB36|nr:hypothetical protein [Acaryochloris marina]QUY46317.1 hypothetical protein I1H34_31510 [Acaryochloris marina S15]